MSFSKQQQRQQALAQRSALLDREQASRSICERIFALVAYQQANTIMWYLDCRSEVQTQRALLQALASEKRIIIPFCTVDSQGDPELGLWWLQDFSELHVGTWGILEPPQARWHEQAKLVGPDELELIVVPGVAFDKFGGRLGYGAGYYDRLLAQVKPETHLVGICFEAQLFPRVFCEGHDIAMHCVLTEAAEYTCQGMPSL